MHGEMAPPMSFGVAQLCQSTMVHLQKWFMGKGPLFSFSGFSWSGCSGGYCGASLKLRGRTVARCGLPLDWFKLSSQRAGFSGKGLEF